MSEVVCEYVSSRGLLKLADVYSDSPSSDGSKDMIYLNNFIKNQDEIYERIKNKREYIILYVCSSMLVYFYEKILDEIRYKFLLVSGDSDRSVPIEVLSPIMFNKIISNKYFVRWYSQNLYMKGIVNTNIVHIPIGLDYHTISLNPKHKWIMSGEGTSPKEQEEILKGVISESNKFSERIPKIYCNVHFALDRFGSRKSAITTIPTELIFFASKFMCRTETWRAMSKYSFVLSPYGNGFDCHRTWEALCLGCIPIVEGALEGLFEGLPVLIVKKWSDITEELLNRTIEEYSKKDFNYEKLRLRYWNNMFEKLI